jgi:hypothetical protein
LLRPIVVGFAVLVDVVEFIDGPYCVLSLAVVFVTVVVVAVVQ